MGPPGINCMMPNRMIDITKMVGIVWISLRAAYPIIWRLSGS